jgi:hypothetical protein
VNYAAFFHCISMKSALMGTMHIEMLHGRKVQKAVWNGLSRLGTRSAVSPVGKDATEAGSSYETSGNRVHDGPHVYDQGAR